MGLADEVWVERHDCRDDPNLLTGVSDFRWKEMTFALTVVNTINII